MKIVRAPMHEVEVQIRNLLAYHYDEVQKLKQVFKLEPDWDKYYRMDREGSCISLLAMDGDVCVGYCVNFLFWHPHYANQFISANDVIFVHKDHRTGTAGARLMRDMRIYSKEHHADLVQWHAKPDTPLDKALGARMRTHEHIYLDPL